jgi:hypothetical protein
MHAFSRQRQSAALTQTSAGRANQRPFSCYSQIHGISSSILKPHKPAAILTDGMPASVPGTMAPFYSYIELLVGILYNIPKAAGFQLTHCNHGRTSLLGGPALSKILTPPVAITRQI